MNDIEQLEKDYMNFVNSLKSKDICAYQNKEIKAEEARKGIIKKLIEERKLTKADAEEYINNIFTDKRTIYNKITLK